MTFPNQRIVTIVPRQGNVEQPYGIISRRESTMAARLLNDKTAAHILYYYFAVNQDAFSFALSPTRIEELLGVTDKQYRKAIKRLIETGYLVPQGDRSNILYFHRMPLTCRDVADDEDECEVETVPTTDEMEAFPPNGMEDTGIETDDDVNDTPEGIAVIPAERRDPIPISIDHGTSTGERNITNNINNTSNTEDLAALDNEKILNDLIQSFRNRFGHLDKCEFELIGIEAKAGKQSYTVEKHIQLLQKTYQQWEESMKLARQHEISVYESAVAGTFPQDTLEHMIAKLSLQRAAKEYGVPIKYGAWIKGWNEELQRPEIYFAPNWLTLEQVKQQSHNIEGIPRWYWKGESPPTEI